MRVNFTLVSAGSDAIQLDSPHATAAFNVTATLITVAWVFATNLAVAGEMNMRVFRLNDHAQALRSQPLPDLPD